MTDVFLATGLTLYDPDDDDAPLHAALAARGLTAKTCAWDDPAVDWSAARACVLRSTWNYFEHLDAFVAWADRCAAVTRLWNPAPVIRWNAHKRYLVDLASRGLPVVPTELVARGASANVEALLARWPDLVIKPAVSAGSFQTKRVSRTSDARAHLAALCDHDVLVQPYLRSVEGHGERALVWIDGVFTHAIRKSPRFSGTTEQISPVMPIEADERAVAEAILAAAPRPLLYARVDLTRDAAGLPVLMELELIEPSLFLVQHAPAADRLAAAIASQL